MRTRILISLLFIFQFNSVQARTWTEAATGKKIEAELVSTEGTSVTIALKTGDKFTIDLSRLAPEDQAFVRQQSQTANPTENPPARVQSQDRFEDVPALKAETIPVRGTENKIFAELDAAILQYMVEKGAPAITMAVSRNGKILYDRAFGWADADLTIPLEPGIRMRIASMSKPVVKAAVLNLIANNKLRAEDKVFDVLNLGQYPEAEKCDPRFKEVTIQQLMDHKGGWDTKTAGDIGNRTVAITKMFKITMDQMEPMHLVRFALSQPLNFTPGEKSSYCNFGYVLLARVLEKISGEKFTDHIQKTIGAEIGATSISQSRTLARDRASGEIWYCYHPEQTNKDAPFPYRAEVRDGSGGIACTAADFCRFLEAYWINGTPRKKGEVSSGGFGGSILGVTSVSAQRADGISFAAIVNRRGTQPGWNAALLAKINPAMDKIAAKLK